MNPKEAISRIKINKLLEAAGWRFFPDGPLPANIQLEPGVTIKTTDLDAFGNDFEKATKGFIDFLLLDSKGFPFIILEAKAEDKNPLVGKEQARKYAKSQNCRFIIFSDLPV
jgi:type I restriction enzyme R subunit